MSTPQKRFERCRAWCCLACLAWVTPSLATAATIESIAKTGDPVPGRSSSHTFFADSTVRPPSVNASGEAVFRAKSALSFDVNSGDATGIYVHRPGSGLAVLADTTTDTSGNPVFEVPGQPGVRFSRFRAPLINDNGDVVFHGSFSGGSGLYATTTSGGPIVKIVDTTDAVPGVAGVTFDDFVGDASTLSGLTVANLTSAGDVILFGRFNARGDQGIYASDVTGAPLVRLADTETTIPSGKSGAFLDIRPEFATNDTGTVAFRGSIGPLPQFLGGLFSVPIDGSAAPTTVAFRTDAAPGSTETFTDNFQSQDINDAGTIVFRAELSGTDFGIYSVDASGGTVTRILDSLGSDTVPGNVAGASFNRFFPAAVNESGQVALFARIFNSIEDQGIYTTDAPGSAPELVVDDGTTAPGLSAPAELRIFDAGGSPAINETGNLAFTASGADEVGSALRGAYFFDACTSELTRIVDSTTAGAELGNSTLDDIRLAQGDDVRSGAYRGINDANDVGLVAEFAGLDLGFFVAHVAAGGGGALSITCPSDAILVCGADTSSSVTGTATAEGCGDVSVSFTDDVAPLCGNTVLITRTWTATSGASSEQCVQFIETKDVVAPTITQLSGSPLVVEVNNPVTLSTSFTDNCAGDLSATWDLGDGTTAVTDPAVSPSTVSHTYTMQNIYSVNVEVVDDCGNATSDQIVIVAFDPDGGFSTGGGNYVPNLGSFINGSPITDQEAKAHFGFVVKYKKNSIEPEGNLQFVYNAGDLMLHDISMEWLVITDSKVRYKGLATNNGTGEFTFRVTAVDDGNSDTFDIEIWEGDVDTENDPPTPLHRVAGTLDGGSIKVH